MDKMNIKDYYTISSEYNAFDIPRMISKKATDKIRSLTNNTAIKVNNLDKLVGFYTGKLTTIGEFINVLDTLAEVTGTIFKGIVHIIKKIREKNYSEVFDRDEEKVEDELPKDKKELSNTHLSYYQFFINVGSIDWRHPANYKNVNIVSHSVITELLNTSIEEKWRDATPLELHNLKLFRPDKIKKEMEHAMEIMKSKSAEAGTEEEWNKIYSVAAKDANTIMDFILSNISNTNGTVKNKE